MFLNFGKHKQYGRKCVLRLWSGPIEFNRFYCTWLSALFSCLVRFLLSIPSCPISVLSDPFFLFSHIPLLPSSCSLLLFQHLHFSKMFYLLYLFQPHLVSFIFLPYLLLHCQIYFFLLSLSFTYLFIIFPSPSPSSSVPRSPFASPTYLQFSFTLIISFFFYSFFPFKFLRPQLFPALPPTLH